MDNKLSDNSTGFSSIHSWQEFKTYLTIQNRFVLNQRQQEFIGKVIKTAQQRTIVLKQGDIWFRARRFFQDFSGRHSKKAGNKKVGGRFPAEKKDVVAPPESKTIEGRANPRRFPMLYLAKEEITAMTEIGPFLGEFIILAAFELDYDLKVVKLMTTN